MGISVKTVEYHKTGLKKELELDSLAELVRYAATHGLIAR